MTASCRLFVWVLTVSVASTLGATAEDAVRSVDQGWTDPERDWFYTTTQGSRMIPFDWFLALETPGGAGLFKDESHMAGFGYLPALDESENPDGLPIGVVADVGPDAGSTAPKAPSKAGDGRVDAPLETARWLGLTSAACHTTQIEAKGRAVRIDGGPTLSDFTAFSEALVEALRATSGDDGRFGRFADRVLGSGHDDDAAEDLHERLDAYNERFEALVSRSKPTHPYGFGWLDAFGILLNEILGTAMGLPENYTIPNAPVSYPFLWDTPDLDWVQ